MVAGTPEHFNSAAYVVIPGGEDTEEVLGWATGAKYDLKKPALFAH